MSENKITGRAKKFDGTAIDYVSIFNWSDGKCIAQVLPDASGAWQYSYSKNINVGVTYVADGCEPITHGPYSFAYEYDLFSDTILKYDFNGDVLDKSANNLNGIKTGSANFVAGRKAGTQALEFVAGCVRTPIALPINSDKLTVSFWFKSNSENVGVIYEFSQNYNNNHKSTALFVNNLAKGTIDANIKASSTLGYNVVSSPVALDNAWHHIVVEVDLSRDGNNEQLIYVDNELTSEQSSEFNANNYGDISNYVMYIGQREASSVPLNGVMQDLRIYNRLLTTSERIELFNE